MTKEKETTIYVLIDRSGSMWSIRDDVIGGFNTFLAEQQKLPEKCRMTYVQFDTYYDRVFHDQDIQRVKPLDEESFIPRGSTALLDAWGKAMSSLQEDLNKLSEGQQPENIIFIVITDGQENASREFTREKLFSMVDEKTKQGWKFTFLAANQDAVAVGRQYGVSDNSCLSYHSGSKGVKGCFGAVARSVTRSRVNSAEDLSYSEEDRNEAIKKE